MSETVAENTWQKRKPHKLTCPSGAACYVQRPSPEISLKGGRLTHIFLPRVSTSMDETAFGELSDEDAAKVYIFAREMVLGSVVSPKLYPDRDSALLTPEDLPPADFWHIFSWAMKGGPDLPVELEEGETTVEAVETFPEEQATVDLSGGGSEPIS